MNNAKAIIGFVAQELYKQRSMLFFSINLFRGKGTQINLYIIFVYNENAIHSAITEKKECIQQKETGNDGMKVYIKPVNV